MHSGYFPSGYIGRVPAFDPDESDRENLRYAVKTNNEAEYFTLNSTTGYIKLNKDLGSNVNHVVEFVIQVSGEYQNPVVTLLGGVDLAIVAYFV